MDKKNFSGKRDFNRGDKPSERTPRPRREETRGDFEKKPFERKPFERKPFEKTPFRKEEKIDRRERFNPENKFDREERRKPPFRYREEETEQNPERTPIISEEKKDVIYEDVSPRPFIAKTMEGLEQVLANELTALGATEVELLTRGVKFMSDKKVLYRANYECRTALRILMPLAEFHVKNDKQLYTVIKKIDWSKYMGLEDTLAVDAVINSDYFTHSQYVALKTKDAIVDQFSEKFDKRPNVNVLNPSLRINIHIYQDRMTVLLDSSGESLHKRGYRSETLEAPINEVLAAGLILLSGWKKDGDFIDPMCGSGTLLTEAAMYAWNIPPQVQRRGFGFQNWKDYDKQLWDEVKSDAKRNIQPFQYQILGFDRDFRAMRASERNAEEAELSDKITVERRLFEKIVAPSDRGIIITNPPYNERIPLDDTKEFYKMIGDTLKKRFVGYEAWLITSNEEAMKSIGLRASRRVSLVNGKLECKFLKFEMYEGTKG